MIFRYLYEKIEDDELKECIAVGLAAGLVAGLAFGLANLFQSDFYVNLLLLIIIIILSELLFLLDKSKPDKKINRLWFTLIHKGEAFFESCLIVINIVAVLSVDWSVVSAFLSDQIPILQQTLYCVGWGTLITILAVGFIYLNSLRYKRGKQ